MEFSQSGSSLSQIVLSLFLFHVFFIPLSCSLSDLVFLDLGTQENEFNNADDDETRLIELPSSFHFGKQNFNTSYISPNGLLSFGTPFISHDATSFPLSSAVVIAPFWDDIILTNTGIAKYGIVTPIDNPNIIDVVETFLKLNQNVVLKLDWVLVAKWMNVCPYENHNCVQTNSFQVVIASQGSTSYSIFTYECNLLQWTRHNSAIGYSAGPDYFENHPFSRTSKVTDIDCLNYPSSVWSNVVYNLNNNASSFSIPTPNDTLGSGSGLGSRFESPNTGLKIGLPVTTAIIFIIIVAVLVIVVVIVVLIKRKSKKENLKSGDKRDDITMTISPSYNTGNISTRVDKTDDIAMSISPSYNIANTSTTLVEEPLYESIPELTESQKYETPVDTELTESQEYETPVDTELIECQEYEMPVDTELIEFEEYDITEIYDLSELITYVAVNINPAYVTPCAQQPDSSQTCINIDDSDTF